MLRNVSVYVRACSITRSPNPSPGWRLPAAVPPERGGARFGPGPVDLAGLSGCREPPGRSSARAELSGAQEASRGL